MRNQFQYSSEVSWDYNFVPKKNISNSKYSKMHNSNNSESGNFFDFSSFNTRSAKKSKTVKSDVIDYTNLDFKNNLNFSKKAISKNKINIPSIYFGLLFVFIFGFLFFLSISIGYASTNKLKDFNEETFYSREESEKILSNYLLPENNKIENSSKKSIAKKITFQDYISSGKESFESVAKKFNLSSETLYLTNNIKKKKELKTGTKLTIPNQDGRLITVQKNESVFKVAERYGVKWEKIADVNNLQSSKINSGTNLFIPESRMSKAEKREFDGKFFIWPVSGVISSNYGVRIDPITGILDFHTGLDIKNNEGTPVRSAREGKVIFTGWQKTYGNFILVKHEKNIITLYAHLESIDVKVDQNVAQGEVIGKVGSTGRTTGPHLHFEVRVNNKIVSPLSYL